MICDHCGRYGDDLVRVEIEVLVEMDRAKWLTSTEPDQFSLRGGLRNEAHFHPRCLRMGAADIAGALSRSVIDLAKPASC